MVGVAVGAGGGGGGGCLVRIYSWIQTGMHS